MCDKASPWRQLQPFATLLLPGVSGVDAELTEHRASAVTLS